MATVNTLLKGIAESEFVDSAKSEQKDLDPLGYARSYSVSCYPEDSMYEDERTILDFIIERQDIIGKQPSLLDIGSASVIPYAVALSRNIESVHMADIFPEHLELITDWVQKRPAARSWEAHTGYIVEKENDALAIIPKELKRLAGEREDEFRRKLNALVKGDLCSKLPLGRAQQYSVVACFYAAEQAAAAHPKSRGAANLSTWDAWLDVLKNLSSLVAPGGHLFLSAICDSDFYAIRELDGTPRRIKIARITDSSLRDSLLEVGLEPLATEIFQPRGLEEEGMNKVILMHAQRLK